MKNCNKCGEMKPLTEYTRETARVDGRANTCRVCYNAHERAKYRENFAAGLLARTRANAKSKGVEFNLTLDDIKIPETRPALLIPIRVTAGMGGGPNSPSIDRVDPAKGYVRGNVEVISKLANAIKTNATADQILAVGNWLKGRTQCS